MSCVKTCEETGVACQNTTCRYWMDYPDDLNCCIVCVHNCGSLTLKEVANRLGLSHVRIKQIQDKAMLKINKNLRNEYILKRAKKNAKL